MSILFYHSTQEDQLSEALVFLAIHITNVEFFIE